jgi:hypothetical protein
MGVRAARGELQSREQRPPHGHREHQASHGFPVAASLAEVVAGKAVVAAQREAKL